MEARFSTIAKGLSRWKTGKAPHVCIVGAGVAGLRCADVLILDGIQVTILEARSRIGGRVHQSNHLGRMVDMGANWIHGIENNPILDLAKQTNSVALSIGEQSSIYDEHGNILEQEKGDNLMGVAWQIISEAYTDSNEGNPIRSDESLEDYFVEQLEPMKLGEDDKKTIMQMSEIWGAFVGGSVATQSLKFLWLEACLEGVSLFNASTYRAILDQIAGPALAKADLRFSTKVTNVESLHGPKGTRKVAIIAEKEVLEFDAAVITVPLGCLKRQSPQFGPPLPKDILTAIKNISYGCLEKVYITFPSAFWDNDLESSGQPDGFPGGRSISSHFLHPMYPQDGRPPWNVECLSLSKLLPGPLSHPTLLFYICGPCGAYVTSLITGLQPSDPKYISLLQEFFEPYYSRMPGFLATSPNCKPSRILATDWQHDELAGYGSYTNFQISQPPKEGEAEVELDKDILALRKGMPGRCVWFAGEHTAPFIATGTVTGAWWSGQSVAKRVARKFSRDDVETHEDEVSDYPSVRKGHGV